LKTFSRTHRFKAVVYILTVFLIFFIYGCSKKPIQVLLSLPMSSHGNWESIINDFPLPENYIFVNEPSDGKIVPEVKIKFFASEEIPLPIDSILLDYVWLVPATDFWNPQTDINMNDLSKYPLIPLDEIKLPQKGLSINNLYPGDPGYPAYESTWLSISFPNHYEEKNELKNDLLEWFTRIKTIHDLSDLPSPQISWIAGVGDMMVQRGVETILIHQKEGARYIFGDTLNILQNQDLLLGNLEGSITYKTRKTVKSYNFKFDYRVLPVLKEVGFDYFSLTNNHIYDYGEKGFRDTLNYLKEAGISTSGAGLTLDEATEYTEISLGNNTVRILSIGAYGREKNGWDGKTMAQITTDRPGILFDGEIATQAVRNMSGPSSFDILMIHGGVEWRSVPDEDQKKIYRSYINAGADMIIGSHPHVLQGMEVWKDKLVAYSLGNFIFPGMGSMTFAEDSMILSAGIINNKIVYLNTVPAKIDNQTILLDKSGSIIERFLTLTKNLIRSQ